MANYKIFPVTTGSGASLDIIVYWRKYQALSDEEYKNDPKMDFTWTYKTNADIYGSEITNTVDKNDFLPGYGKRAGISIEAIRSNAHITIATSPNFGNTASMGGMKAEKRDEWPAPEDFTAYTSAGTVPTLVSFNDPRVTVPYFFNIDTNIPIFETTAELNQYLAYGDNIQNAVNNEIPSVEGRLYEITCIWAEGTWGPYGYTPGAVGGHRDARFRSIEERPIAFYIADGLNDGGICYGVVKSGEFMDIEYSLDGIQWQTSDYFPFNYIYRPRADEQGTFRFALSFYAGGTPLFPDEETANGYLQGDVDITEALNWDDISGFYPDVEQETGEPDDGTDWGQVFAKSFFHNQYLMTDGGVQEVSNALYDVTSSGIWEDIKKGLEMYGQNPMNAVMSLMFYPIDLSSIFSYVSDTSSVWFGGYQFQLQNHTAKKIIYPDGFFYCGGVTFMPKFKNWRDTKATRIFIDLPYCGRYELDPAKYWGKHVNVVYYIDTHTGGCIACLVEGASTATREGRCLDQFNGQIGVNCPITLTDFSAYANAQINTLLGNGGQAVNNALNVADSGRNALATGGGATALGLAGAGITAGALGAVQGAKTVYGLMMNNINKFNQTRGGSTGMLNQFANQKPTFIFVYPETDNPANFNAMYGTPSNYGGPVSSFVGHLEVDTVKLNMPGATESEKEKVRALLMGGIYIQ